MEGEGVRLKKQTGILFVQLVKERPIIFNSEMVRAILDGRKTQTRRPIKPQPIQPKEGAYFDKYYKGPQWNWFSKDNKQFLDQIINCPYGKVGDRLWVRESFIVQGDGSFSDVVYRVDHCDNSGKGTAPWKPSIHMPRWASRISLEITDVRVERVQEITDGDGRSEGIPNAPYAICGISSFELLWNSIYKKTEYKWQNNPWVWVIEFKRVDEKGLVE